MLSAGLAEGGFSAEGGFRAEGGLRAEGELRAERGFLEVLKG